jgi:SAM-dependent methyltransferase
MRNKITSMGPWYQNMNLDGEMTIKPKQEYYNAGAGEKAWKSIKKFLPDNLKGKRVLDLGCNAGYYSIQSLLLGAKEVVGIELSPIFFKQALFIKDFFEKKEKKTLNVKYIQSNISDVDFESLGNFEYIFAIAVLYHIGKHQYGKYTPKALQEQKNIIKKLTGMSNNVIVRSRNSQYNSAKYYSTIFSAFDFKLINQKIEGKRSLLHYRSS